MKTSTFLTLFLIATMIGLSITLLVSFMPIGRVVAMDYTNLLTGQSRLQLSAVVDRGYYIIELEADRDFSYVLEVRVGQLYFSLKGNSNGRLIVPLKVSQSDTSIGVIANIKTEEVRYASLKLLEVGNRFGLWGYMLSYFGGSAIYITFLVSLVVLGFGSLENLKVLRYAKLSSRKIADVVGEVFLDVWVKPRSYIYGSVGTIIVVLFWLFVGPAFFDVVTSGIPSDLLGITPTDFAFYWFTHLVFYAPQLLVVGFFVVYGKTRLILSNDEGHLYIYYDRGYGFDLSMVTPICDVEPPECKLRLDLERSGVQVRVFEITINCSEAYRVCQRLDNLIKQN